MTPTPPLVERLRAAGQEVSDATKRQWDGKPALRLSIPARPDRDSDLLIVGALCAAEAALVANTAEIDRLTAALTAAHAAREEAERTSEGRRVAYDVAMREMRGVDEDDVCQRCAGTGASIYASSSAWAGGVGGMTPTRAACDRCWGSGEAARAWPSHRDYAALRAERDALAAQVTELQNKIDDPHLWD